MTPGRLRGLVLALLLLGPPVFTLGLPKDPPRKQSKASIVMEAVLAGASLFAVRPELRHDPEVVARVSSTGSLLLLFDEMNDSSTLDTLAAMSSYYLGESPGGTFQCLLIRKGQAMKGRLAALLKARTNDCKKRYEKASDEVREAACLDEVVYKAKLTFVLDYIGRKERCDEL